MYRKFLPIALVALFSVMMIGCTEDPLSPDNPIVKAEVDGTSKETTSVTATKLTSTINIDGAFSDGTRISLTVPIVESPQTFDLSDLTNKSAASYLVASPLQSFLATSGEIEIKTIDDNGITGTFSFEGKDAVSNTTIDVSDGSFSAKF
ncbi:MAG: DUF6252 family protein [Candidatus Kapaibacterium sp.]